MLISVPTQEFLHYRLPSLTLFVRYVIIAVVSVESV